MVSSDDNQEFKISERATPVSALAQLPGLRMNDVVGRSIQDLAPHTVTRLIHYRLRLERTQGWAIFMSFAAAFAGIYALSGHVRSELLLGIYAAAVACLAATSASVVERGGMLLFLRRAKTEGMSIQAAETLYRRAKNAGPLVDVLKTLNRTPQESDLLRFVTDEPPRR